MEIQIRQATIQDLNVLMQWRMEVLHEVFSIPSERSVTELESENRRYYQTELPQGGHIACFAYVGEEIVGCGGIIHCDEMPSPDNRNGKFAYLMNIYTRPQVRGHGIRNIISRGIVRQARQRQLSKIYL